MSLKQFVSHENRVRAFMGQPQLDVNTLSSDEARLLYLKLDSNMSPEILHQDGERSPAEARRYAALYRAAFAELRALGHTPPSCLYNLV